MTDWTLITVTYNSAEVLRSHWDAGRTNSVEWLVVDNASTDDSADTARQLGATVEVLAENCGFSVANNVALRRAAGRYVAFVNPDVRVDFKSLQKLAHRIDESGGIVAPQLLNPDGSLQPNARGIPFLVDKFAHRGIKLPFSRLSEYVIEPDGRQLQPIAFPIGAAVAGLAEMFRSLGGWDERFFIYYEDHELGLRARERGIPVWIDRTIKWQHGWDRATMQLSVPHWRHEFASAVRFYRLYPGLLLATRARRDRAWASLNMSRTET